MGPSFLFFFKGSRACICISTPQLHITRSLSSLLATLCPGFWICLLGCFLSLLDYHTYFTQWHTKATTNFTYVNFVFKQGTSSLTQNRLVMASKAHVLLALHHRQMSCLPPWPRSIPTLQPCSHNTILPPVLLLATETPATGLQPTQPSLQKSLTAHS